MLHRPLPHAGPGSPTRGDSPLQVPLVPPCPPPPPPCPPPPRLFQFLQGGGQAPRPHPRYEFPRGSGPVPALPVFLRCVCSTSRHSVPPRLPQSSCPGGSPPIVGKDENSQRRPEAPRHLLHCLQVSGRGRLRPPPTPSPGRPIILQGGAPALPLKMDVDRPQGRAWARGGRRRAACLQRPPGARAVACAASALPAVGEASGSGGPCLLPPLAGRPQPSSRAAPRPPDGRAAPP